MRWLSYIIKKLYYMGNIRDTQPISSPSNIGNASRLPAHEEPRILYRPTFISEPNATPSRSPQIPPFSLMKKEAPYLSTLGKFLLASTNSIRSFLCQISNFFGIWALHLVWFWNFYWRAMVWSVDGRGGNSALRCRWESSSRICRGSWRQYVSFSINLLI